MGSTKGLHGVLAGFAVIAVVHTQLVPGQTQAQSTRVADTASARGQQAPARPAGAPVILGTDTLFRLYGSLGPFSPEARAAAVSARLRELTPRIASKADSIVVVDAGTHTELAVGDAIIMTVLDSDAAPLHEPRLAVARYDARVAFNAMVSAAGRNGIRALTWAASYAVLATLALLVILRLLSAATAIVRRRLTAARGLAARAMRIKRFEIISADRLIASLLTAVGVARIVVTVLVFYIYVPLVLSFFPWTAPLSRRIVTYALTPFGVAWNSIVGFLPNLFYLAAIAVLTRVLLKFIHALFRAVESGAVELAGFHRDWGEPTYKIVRFMVLAFMLVVAFPYLPGASSDAFKGVSVFVGVLLSFGSSSAVGNVIAGLVLTYTGAFKLGDRVQLGDTIGDVIERTLLVTRIRTIKNVEITVPNGAVLSGHVINYSALAATRGLILHTTVTIGYDSPWQTVHRLLMDAARRTEHILATPAPFVLQTSLDDFYVSYELNAYTDQPGVMAVTYSLLHANIQDAFNEGGVEIMSPHYASLRDGNESTIPAAPGAAPPPTFRVQVVSPRSAD